MTALTEYDRLEAPGLWRAGRFAQRRDVVVSIGDATLAIYDRTDTALAHWSLPAVERRNPGRSPALYAPGPDSAEELELDDETMIAAIERVRKAVDRHRPHRGRLRLLVLAGTMTALAALAVFWLPDALIRHAVSIVPDATRDQIGDRLLDHVARLSGGACHAEAAAPALSRVAQRLLGADGRLVVLRDAATESEYLPGGIVAVNRALIEDHDSPDALAGYVLAELERASVRDPLARMLQMTGPMTAFRLLTTGRIPETTLASHAETLLVTPPEAVETGALLARLDAAQVGAAPYAEARKEAGAPMADPVAAAPVSQGEPRPIIGDGQWVALQGICGF